ALALFAFTTALPPPLRWWWWRPFAVVPVGAATLMAGAATPNGGRAGRERPPNGGRAGRERQPLVG
ncbi:hypothetical protein B296_00043026, partial [Ensete ventricosum]